MARRYFWAQPIMKRFRTACVMSASVTRIIFMPMFSCQTIFICWWKSSMCKLRASCNRYGVQCWLIFEVLFVTGQDQSGPWLTENGKNVKSPAIYFVRHSVGQVKGFRPHRMTLEPPMPMASRLSVVQRHRQVNDFHFAPLLT